MSRLSLDQLTQAHLDQLYDALDALSDMFCSYGQRKEAADAN